MKKMILNNLDYFNISKNNLEPHLDEFYIFINKHPEINQYLYNTNKIKNILITIKTLEHNNEEIRIIDKYYEELCKNINKYSNTNEFSCFVNACDNSIDSIKDEIEILKIIVEKYFENRVLNEFTPIEWIQALIDNNSSRKKGKCGEDKLSSILENIGFKRTASLDDLKEKKFSFLRFSSKINLKIIRKEFGLEIKTRTQNKNLDLIIKSDKKIFLCEAKHINTSGGGQDKQISELIELLNIKENNKNIHIISFLDGKYSNKILDDSITIPKILTQRNQIKEFLKNNPNNFWLNTAGFKKLFSNLLANF
jgi:hypothetical protein